MSLTMKRRIENACEGDPRAREEIEARIHCELLHCLEATTQLTPGATESDVPSTRQGREPVSTFINTIGRLLLDRDSGWEAKIYFYSIAARQLRLALRQMGGETYGELHSRVKIDDNSEARAISFMQWDDLLSRLAEIDPLKATLAELYFYGGMSYEGIAKAVDRSVVDVDRLLRFTKAWLYLQLMHM